MNLDVKTIALISCNGNPKKPEASLSKMIISVDSISNFAERFNSKLRSAHLWNLLFSMDNREVAASVFGEKNVRSFGKLNYSFNSLSDAMSSNSINDEFKPTFILIFDHKTNDICWFHLESDSQMKMLNNI